MQETKSQCLEKSITCLYGVSTAREKLYARLGIKTLKDLLYHFPVNHENRGNTVNVDSAPSGEICSLILEVITPVTSTRLRSSGKRAMTVQKFVARDCARRENVQ